jgi:hypothetical protein
MAIQRAIGDAVGSNTGRANMGVWITPQASYLDTLTFQKHQDLYLLGGGPGAAPSTNNLLNLSDPRAQDLFFHQFETLIVKYNCSRVWCVTVAAECALLNGAHSFFSFTQVRLQHSQPANSLEPVGERRRTGITGAGVLSWLVQRL